MPDTMLDKVRESYRISYESRGLDKVEKRVEGQIERKRSKRALKILKSKISLENKRILEVGCGKGELIVTFNLNGINAIGITPDDDEIAVARSWQEHYNLKNKVLKGTGENLDFSDEQFDVIISHNVLEHVNDVRRTIAEMIRALRQKGYLYIKAPNYWKPKEGHYDMFWIPFMPKQLAKFYLKARGKPTEFLDTIHYTTPQQILGELKKYDVKITHLNKAGFFSPIEILVQKQ